MSLMYVITYILEIHILPAKIHAYLKNNHCYYLKYQKKKHI